MDDEPGERVGDGPVGRLRSTLEEHPVRLAVLFGSQATGRATSGSDIDIAVELDGLQPGDEGFNDAFFDIIAAVSRALETDDVDVVDVHTLGPSMADAVFDRGTLVVGEESRLDELRARATSERDERSPGERFDDALRKIDEHLA